MLDLEVLAIFAAACLVLTATPGPDMLLIASRSVSQGRISGFATLMGIQAGTYCHALAAALGLSQLFVAVPIAYDAVRYIGAAYLLYLAWQAFRSGGAIFSPTSGATHLAMPGVFVQGLLTNLLNPKMALFVLALFPQFVDLNAGGVAGQILVLATVLNAVGLVVNGVVILAADRFRNMLSARGRSQRLLPALLGTVYAGLALRLVLDARR